MSPRRPTSLACLLAVGSTLPMISGCTEEPVSLPLRSLSSSGPIAFVCLDAPDGGDAAGFGRPLEQCTSLRASSPDDYYIPHLYALVLQTLRGEVAVVDLTTDSRAVLDQDPQVPGATFLPVGAAPTDIVASPGGMASFVAAAEPGYEGIYALPSHLIRGAAPRLSTWPSCSLPARPGAMVLAQDPPDGAGQLRPSCDADYGTPDVATCGPDGEVHCHGDLSAEAATTDHAGRHKLIVALPAEGGIAVIDAQDVLDREPGSFEPCTVERWVPLQANVSTPPPPPQLPEEGCVNEEIDDGASAYAEAFVAEPTAMELSEGRLYIGDRSAPVIHVVDLASPCEPIERPPLLPRAVEDPTRMVTTTHLTVSPPTLDFKQYLYAIDLADGSTMVFDVSDDATTRTPLERSHPELNPFQPADRIRFHTPPRALVSVQHLNDDHDDQSGSNIPVRCDPDPDSESPGTVYQTAANYESGASPYKLRGVFTFIVLATGDVVVIDVDDYDAPCRGPKQPHPLFGCDPANTGPLATSGEFSCRTVVPHQTRAGGYLLEADEVANNQPGIQAYPVLFDPEGSAINLDDTDEGRAGPRMRATVPDATPSPFTLPVGSDVVELDSGTGQAKTAQGLDEHKHVLAMNLEEPRAHILDQAFTVTYEGPIPGFGGRFAELVAPAASQPLFKLREASSRFCDRGVLGSTAMRDILLSQGLPAAQAESDADRYADYVHLVSATPVDGDPYWDEAAVTFTQCRTEYGTVDQPRATRDFRIVEAYNHYLEMEPRSNLASPDGPQLKDCFPGVVEFEVRVGSQWSVVGEAVGFLHHVVPDPETGACRNSCNPDVALLNGRARDFSPGTVVRDDDPFAFRNPFFRFAIIRGEAPSKRDMQFQFATRAAFSSLARSLITDDADIQPQAIEFLEQTGELVVSDGSLEGITLLDLNYLAVTRQYN